MTVHAPQVDNMANKRSILMLLTLLTLIFSIHAERTRYEDSEEASTEDFLINNQQETSEDDVIETFKRFLMRKKEKTPKPSSDTISGLVLTSPRNRLVTGSTPSMYGSSGRKYSSTSRYDTCERSNPCKNGGTCRTLSNGKYFCFCSSEYYGKNCENKFHHLHSDSPRRSGKNHCATSPCRNGGECISLNTTYYCRCKTPYYGINCDKRISKREELVDDASNSSEQGMMEVK